jgi:alpha-mannosidase
MHSDTNNPREIFFFIPHTHWEGAVFKTREQYLEMGLPNILRALRLLKLHPDYRFTLDQACYVEPFLRRYPAEAAAFRQFIEEGRLAIVGGTDSMADVNMPGGESFVRQVLYGKGYFRRELGVDVTTGWQLDTFGHHAQMPQLLKLAGFTSFWFFRGVADWDVPAEFLWEGIDGSRISAFWLPHGYAITYGSPSAPTEFARSMEERFDKLAPFARASGRVGLAGADVCEPEEHVPLQVAEFNRRADRPFHLQLAVPGEYEAAVERRGSESGNGREVVTGELNPIFQGTYSSRIELKQRVRELECQLTTAEKLGVVLDCLGLEADGKVLWRAWEPMLFNQAHDLMSGVMTDQVYEDTIRSFDSAKRLAESEVQARLQGLLSRVDTRGEGIPLVVFNTMGWPRTDLAVADVGLTDDGITDVQLVGPDGRVLPVQILESERNAGGGLLRVKIAFVARQVPPLGYATYRLLPLSSAAPLEPVAVSAEDAVRDGNAVLENEYYRLELDSGSGAITGLVVKDGDWEALRETGNVVAMEEDRGDLWELYRPLDGASRTAMKEQHPAPASGQATLSNEPVKARGTVTRGPVFAEFQITLPLGDTGQFSTRVRLCAGLRRIEVRTEVLNNEKFVRYRVLFPTTIGDGESVHEIPFGAIPRPDGIEFPAQNWIDYSNGDRGIALLNRGLPGNNVADGTMMLSLMRCTSIVAYGFGGGYEPGMSSDSGFELGKTLGFDYALVPHSGDWRRAEIYQDGMELNHPLLAHTAACHPGALPSSWSFLEVSHPHVVVSALKPGEHGGAVLRIYEAAGLSAEGVRITLTAQVAAAEEVNLMEDLIEKISVVDNAVELDLGPHEIKTLRFVLQGAPSIAPKDTVD